MQSILNIAPSIFSTGTNSTVFNGLHINISAMPNPFGLVGLRISNTFGQGILQTAATLTNNFAGNTLFGAASTPTDHVDINGANGFSQLRLRTAYTPTGTADTNGNTGDISWDENFMYVKTSAGWKRSALTTF